ncbi:DNA/RNA nuclease SfsA [Wohlfahrtiimonas chitiniclastica]|uniref:DNA/RNA nuclease SfsA n=1 Tax=Wohlfahrtiimonas chitiniclastica TaxID=400946 RepID=UPI0007B69B41|nr:DNA/RNA nuclease SfsA [Wohlfahrtiimonas chitiniclastica]KZX37447.1 sugar fermentation stimulation protein SfsA [Wohlfahrtiimonas chitiniclastica]MBS7818125.1 DNA/RNA nuclease SfsA [Wohlfahrtiimonas chitiniclastica]MBS7826125.1 DNA/RNA nuclease SfsA [Wohlfahrtiimonas chitiniclastica]
MDFKVPLQKATLLKRYKRFLADVVPENSDETITIHCANTGSMLNCFVPNGEIWYEPSQDPSRKTKGSWTLSTTPQGRTACINTHLANALVEEALNGGIITELTGFTRLKREVKYGAENSKIDFYLEYADGRIVYLEVKSVTLGFEDGNIAAFPDAVTTRGAKHLRELMNIQSDTTEAYILYCVNLSGIEGVRVASEIDAAYASAFDEAVREGVKPLVYGTTMDESGISITHRLPFVGASDNVG